MEEVAYPFHLSRVDSLEKVKVKVYSVEPPIWSENDDLFICEDRKVSKKDSSSSVRSRQPVFLRQEPVSLRQEPSPHSPELCPHPQEPSPHLERTRQSVPSRRLGRPSSQSGLHPTSSSNPSQPLQSLGGFADLLAKHLPSCV